MIETKPLEIWMSSEGARAVLERAKERGEELGAAFCDLLQQRMCLRRAGDDLDLLLRECGDGECLKLDLPADRFQDILGLLLAHRCLRLRCPAQRAPSGSRRLERTAESDPVLAA